MNTRKRSLYWNTTNNKTETVIEKFLDCLQNNLKTKQQGKKLWQLEKKSDLNKRMLTCTNVKSSWPEIITKLAKNTHTIPQW